MDFEKLNNVMKEKRSTVADYHARNGRIWRIFGEKDLLHVPLAYAAFEFRLAMERCLLELLYLINNKHLSVPELKYDMGQLIKGLYKTQSPGKDGKEKLQRRIEFNSIYFEHLPYGVKPEGKKFAIVDVNLIEKFWVKLSKYCHRQLTSENTWDDTNWVKKGYDLLNEVENYIWRIMVDSQVGWLDLNTVPKQIQLVANDFIEGKIDTNSLDQRLRLIMPVLEHKELMYSKIITVKLS